MKYFLVIVLLSLNIFSFLNAKAGIETDMQQFFDAMGYASNITQGGVYKDQAAGYYTGGSVFARTPSRNIDLVNIQMPSYKAGCGGIDLFTGGFSFINSDRFIQFLKNIGSNALGYAFQLALQTATPQIYNTISELNALAQEINNTSINSCEAAANLVGGVWPKSEASSKLLCTSMGSQKNAFSDWAQARQGCGAEGRRDEINAQKSPEFKDVLGDEFNLAWKALSKNGFLSADPTLAEFFMSLSGSIISRNTGGGRLQISHLPSLANNSDLLSVLLTGEGEAQIYQCDDREEDRCLNPRKGPFRISKSSALLQKVDGILRELERKVQEDEGPLTQEERGLIQSTSIPILKILGVQVAFKGGASPITLSEFSEAIAHDLLLKYLEQVLELVNESVIHLQKVQINENTLQSFKEDMAQIRRLLLERRNGAFQQMQTTLSAIERAYLIEQQLHSHFTAANKGE